MLPKDLAEKVLRSSESFYKEGENICIYKNYVDVIQQILFIFH